MKNLDKLYRFPISSVTNPDLTTAQLAQRTGLTAGTLRIWESRYGFPEPGRLAGGHRRYSAADLEDVREVVRLRQEGLSLPAAIERVRNRRRLPGQSVFAGLRERRPDATGVVLHKPALLALTRAIEDEYCAHAAAGVLIGSFQRERFYRRSEHRWRELARTADLAVALADFPRSAAPEGGAVEVPIDRRHALSREWAVLISAHGVQACLAAWELPATAELPAAGRRFEVLWSFEPRIVADALAVAASLLGPLNAEVAAAVRAAPDQTAVDPALALRNGGALSQRIVGYLGQIPGGG